MTHHQATKELRNMSSGATRNPGIAAILSLLVPGFGQFYTGHFIWGILWLIITPGFWIGSAGLFGWPFHILASIQAYRQAERRSR